MEPRTVADLVRPHVTARPDVVAVSLDGDEVTWRELDARSARVAAGLEAAGVGAAGRVAVVGRNSLAHLEVMLAASRLGAVYVPVNWRLAPEELLHVLGDAEAVVVVVVGSAVRATVDDLQARLPLLRLVLDAAPGGSYEDWREGHAPGTHTGADVDVDPASPVLQLYSSGTTGRAKGVLLSHHNIVKRIEVTRTTAPLGPHCVNLVPMPLFHVGGAVWAVAGLAAGARTVLAADADPVHLLSLMVSQRVTHAFLVPSALRTMLAAPGLAAADLSHLDTILYGGSPIDRDVLVQAMVAMRCGFCGLYGLTESTGTIAHLLPAHHDPHGPLDHRLRSAGQVVPMAEVRIVDLDTGATAHEGAPGEVWVRSPQVMVGYWRLPEATAEALPGDGWLRTGDVGRLDRDGFLYLQDRVKDMIISGGENIYPAEVEQVIAEHPAVAEVAVIAVPSPRWGETPRAVVVVRAAGATPNEAELAAWTRERLAHFKCPTSWEFVDTLPRNATGKVLKRELRAPHWEGADNQVR